VARWLVKTDPRLFAWEDLAEGPTVWNGVRSPPALRYLAAFRKGDAVLLYHSGGRSAIVGLARALSDAYADPEGTSPRHVAVDLEAEALLARPVHRRELVALAALAGWELVRVPRLTVLPVPPAAWRAVRRLGASGKMSPGGRRGR
jgi:predicted RNA-binding protein with PUA-like domain